jgi:hypothetical protein
MADKKISALTGASTPLAGSEVLPIVQSGSTVKVAVSDLTAGRNVNTAKLTATDAEVSGSGYAARTLKLLPNTADTGYFTTITDNIDTNMTISKVIFGKATTNLVFFDGNITNSNGNFVLGTAGKGITNSTGSVALNFSTVGTALTGGSQSVLTGSFNNVGTAQTVTPDDTRGGTIVITAIQPGIGSTTYTLPFVKRGGTVAIGTPSKAILTADPILTVAASGGGIVITPVAANTFITYAIYYTPLGA